MAKQSGNDTRKLGQGFVLAAGDPSRQRRSRRHPRLACDVGGGRPGPPITRTSGEPRRTATYPDVPLPSSAVLALVAREAWWPD
jgi:hypothetical protein